MLARVGSFFAVTALMVAVGLLTAGSPARRTAGLLLAGATAIVPFLFPTDLPALRFVSALGVVLCAARAFELSGERPARSAAVRVWHTTGVIDTTRVTRGPSTIDLRLLSTIVAFGAVGAAGLYVALELGDTRTPTGWLVRWLGGVTFAYATIDAAERSLRWLYGVFGVRVGRMHDHPIVSRTVTELWGRRWNQIVGGFLRRRLYAPLARRSRPWLGLAAAFLVSTLLHVYLAWAALGLGLGLVMGAFFVSQAVLVALERGLRVARWPRRLARAWTLTTVLATSPLFVEPTLRVFAGR